MKYRERDIQTKVSLLPAHVFLSPIHISNLERKKEKEKKNVDPPTPFPPTPCGKGQSQKKKKKKKKVDPCHTHTPHGVKKKRPPSTNTLQSTDRSDEYSQRPLHRSAAPPGNSTIHIHTYIHIHEGGEAKFFCRGTWGCDLAQFFYYHYHYYYIKRDSLF